MAQRPRVALFVPPSFEPAPLDLERLRALNEREWHYAVMGRWALYSCLRTLGVAGRVLIPTYICDTVLEPLARLRLEPIFYDLDQRDLNASLDSICERARASGAKTLVVASMYGNPADLAEIERWARDAGVVLVDDAAQSFGATLGDRAIGTFGDAGFFSFSPGKPAAGALGAFWWTAGDAGEARRASHSPFHRVAWLDFRVNRLESYAGHARAWRALGHARRLLGARIDLATEGMPGFEDPLLGGILGGLLDGRFDFRARVHAAFVDRFGSDERWRIVTAVRGTPHPHKIVLVCRDAMLAEALRVHLAGLGIVAACGYPLLSRDARTVPHAGALNGRVVELPIEEDPVRIRVLFDSVDRFER